MTPCPPSSRTGNMFDVNGYALAITIVVSSAFCSLSVSATGQEFFNKPEDQTIAIQHGETSYFHLYCTVSALEVNQKVTWYIGDIPFADNTAFRDYSQYIVDWSRYTLHEIADKVGSVLGVQKITLATATLDSGPFKCAITTQSGEVVKLSRVAQVTIYEVPRLGHPLCRVSDPLHENIATNNSITLIEGDPYTFTCLSDPGYPTVTMSWSRNDVSGSLQEYQATINDNGLLFLTYLWKPSRLDSSGLNFTCTFVHPGLTHNRTCTVGNFDIQYPPTVEINTTQEYVTADHIIISFTCTPDSNPPVNQISWMYNGELIVPGTERNNTHFHFKDFSMRITLLADQENGFHYVRCDLNNTLGTGSANTSFIIDIPEVLRKKGWVIIWATTSALIVLLIVITVFIVAIVRQHRKSRPHKSSQQHNMTENDSTELDQSLDNVAYATVSVAFKRGSDGEGDTASADIQFEKTKQEDLQLSTRKGDRLDDLEKGRDKRSVANVKTLVTSEVLEELKKNIPNENNGTIEDKNDKTKKPDIRQKPKHIKTRRKGRGNPEESAYENIGPMTNRDVNDITTNDQSEKENLRQKQLPSDHVYDAVNGSFGKPRHEVTSVDEEGTYAPPNDPRSINVEGLTYAELDLSNVKPSVVKKKPTNDVDEDTVYAELKM